MMPDQQKPRDVANRRGTGIDKPLDAEQRLMLLGRQALPLRRRLAEGKEYTQLITKLRQRLVVNASALPLRLTLVALDRIGG